MSFETDLRISNVRSKSKIQSSYHRLQSWFGHERGALVLVWCLRFGGLLLLIAWAWYRADEIPSQQLGNGWLAIIALGSFHIATAIFGMRRPSKWREQNVKFLQNLIELLLISLVIFYLNSANNVLWVLYLVPIVSAIRFLTDNKRTIVISAAIVMAALVGFLSSSRLLDAGVPLIITTFGTLVLYVLRRLSTNPSALVDQKTEIAQILDQHPGGICVIDQQRRLVFVNSSLVQQFGSWSPAQTCDQYLRCEHANCLVCQHPQPSISRQNLRLPNNRKVPFSVESRAIADGQLLLLFLKPASTVRFDLYEHLLHALVEGNEQSYRNALSRFLDSIRQDFRAESAAIFWLVDGRLQRDICSGPPLPFTEYYEPGQGITGLTLISVAESQLGRTIVVNNLGELELASVSHSLTETSMIYPKYHEHYQQALPSRQVRHLIAAPINGRQRIIGVLRLVNHLNQDGKPDDDGFQRFHETDLNLICERLAQALEYREFYLEQQRQLDEIRRFYRIYAASTRGREVFETIVEEALHAFSDASKCEIRRFDRFSQTLQFEAARHRRGFDYGSPSSKLSGVNARAIREETIQYVEDTQQDADFIQRDPPIGALMVAPLIGYLGVGGILTIDYPQPRTFTAEERKRFEMLATHARLAAAVIWRNEQSECLHRHIQKIGQEVSEGLPQVYRNVLTALHQLIGYDAASIQLLSNSSLQIVECDGFTNPDIARTLWFTTDDESLPHSRVIRQQQPLIVYDVAQEFPQFVAQVANYCSKTIHSALYLPLLYRNQCIGLIALKSSIPLFYRSGDLVIGQLIANAAASAIDNARLVEALQLHQTQLHDLLIHSTKLLEMPTEQQLLRSYAQLGTKLFDCEHCAIFLRRRASGLFEIAASSQDEMPDDDPCYRQIAETVAVSNRIIRLRGEELSTFYAKHGLIGDELIHLPTARGRSLLAGSVQSQDGLTLVIVLENRAMSSDDDNFPEASDAFLILFGQQVLNGFAIINMRRITRESLGIDVHDLLNLIQGTIIFPSTILQKQFERDEALTPYRQRIINLNRAANYVYQELRNIQDDLRGLSKLEKPFIELLNEHVELVRERIGDHVSIHIESCPQVNIPTDVTYALFRIFQEALTNIAKHAGFCERKSGNIWISFNVEQQEFTFLIEDDGKGFVTTPANREESYGLRSICDRAKRIGAVATIEPRLSGGVRVCVKGRLVKGEMYA